MADTHYTIHLTLEELRVIKRVVRHLTRGVYEGRKFVQLDVSELLYFGPIFTKIAESVAHQVLNDER